MLFDRQGFTVSPKIHADLARADLTSSAREVLERCEQAALFSEEPGKITRRFLSEPMRRLLARITWWTEQAGLAARVDSAGNLIGHYPGLRADAPVVLIGSHLDSVPDAGRYDGVLGVMLGLAAVQALGRRRLPFGIDVIGFSEEEGIRYRTPFLGSRAACGCFDPNLLEQVDRDGITMAQAFRAFGLEPERIGEAAYPAGGVLAYLEPHIEQGRVLESLEAPVGVVTTITGQTRIWAEFKGQASHAGTTPMEGRRDSLAAASALVLEVERLAGAVPGLRATVGTMTVEPGAVNVVPGLTRLSIDIRHESDQARAAAVDELGASARALAARRGVEFRVREQADHPAVPADPAMIDLLACAMTAGGHEPHRLPSGAGHDAAIMARIAPMGMLFLRSPGGISHHPEECVESNDVAVALEVLNRSLELLADQVTASGESHEMSPLPESHEWRSLARRAAAFGSRTP
jgi:allantoate deiminase